mgnify:CR=1 FL=1
MEFDTAMIWYERLGSLESSLLIESPTKARNYEIGIARSTNAERWTYVGSGRWYVYLWASLVCGSRCGGHLSVSVPVAIALPGDTGRTAGRVELPVIGLRPERREDWGQGRRADTGGSWPRGRKAAPPQDTTNERWCWPGRIQRWLMRRVHFVHGRHARHLL